MSDMATTYRRGHDETREATAATCTEGRALITEQQVLLSTASAVALPPAKTRRWSDVIPAVSGALRALFAATEKPPARRHYPKRYSYLENALMAREMHRL